MFSGRLHLGKPRSYRKQHARTGIKIERQEEKKSSKIKIIFLV